MLWIGCSSDNMVSPGTWDVQCSVVVGSRWSCNTVVCQCDFGGWLWYVYLMMTEKLSLILSPYSSFHGVLLRRGRYHRRQDWGASTGFAALQATTADTILKVKTALTISTVGDIMSALLAESHKPISHGTQICCKSLSELQEWNPMVLDAGLHRIWMY